MPAPVRRKLLFACLSLLALAMVAAGNALAGNGGIAPPAETPNAGRIQDLYWIVLGITGAIFLLVEGALILFIVQYRNRGRPRADEGPQIRGHTRLELIWTGIPVLIIAAIMSFVFYKLPGIKDVPEANAAGEKLTVRVEGRQFYWRYVYPNRAASMNELRLPAGRPIELELTAPANDVIHSWWVPAVAGKMDAIPGQVNHLRFEAPSKPGVYKGQCAEFCGIQHALMVASVRVVPGAEFDTWLEAQFRLDAGGNLGKQIFDGACAPCHGMNGEGLIGPPLEGNATLTQGAQLRQLLANGKNAMPPVGRGWSQRELASLFGYLQQEFASGR
jgi:cytochrome c oxidase subunit 2